METSLKAGSATGGAGNHLLLNEQHSFDRTLVSDCGKLNGQGAMKAALRCNERSYQQIIDLAVLTLTFLDDPIAA